MKIKPLKTVLALLWGATPATGRAVRKLGLRLLGGSAATGTAATTLPDVPDSWVQVLRMILEILTVVQAIVGIFVLGAGQAQTNEYVEGQ